MITIKNINPALNKSVEIDTGRQLGVTAGVWLQEKARQTEEYNQPIDNWQIGKDKEGNEIQINTLGRWLFGVPGYDGHIRISTDGTIIAVHYPSEPSGAEKLFNRLKTNIDGEEVRDGDR
jgi:hypothetical protein